MIKKLSIAVIAATAFLLPQPCAAQQSDIKVMSFNIRYDNPGDASRGEGWDTRRDAVANLIIESNADIVGTQEVLSHQYSDLKQRLKNYEVVGCGRDDGKKAGEYEALWFRTDKFEKIDTGNFWLSETPEIAGSLGWDGACVRMASWALLRHKESGKKILAINTHLDHVGAVARREGVNLILEKLKTLAPGIPAVVTGDFNSGPASAPVKHITDRTLPFHLVDSRKIAHRTEGPQWTFHDFDRQPLTDRLIIDYIFVTPGVKIDSYEIIPTTPSAENSFNISDHNAVMVSISDL